MKEKEIIRKFIRKVINEQIEGIGNMSLSQEILNEILKGYLEAALWTEEDNLKDSSYVEDNDDDDEMSEVDRIIGLQSKLNQKPFQSFIVDDLDDDSKIQAYIDIKKFIQLAGEDAVNEAINEQGNFRLGMDIWLTRNGHGSGFFDHSYDFEDELMNAARQLNSVDLYLTDDNRIVFSNSH